MAILVWDARPGLVFILLTVLCIPGCGGRRPGRGTSSVEEVTIAESGVSIQEGNLASLESQWATWRGPHGNGIATSDTAPVAWSESEGIAWQVDVPGRGHGSPIVVDDLVLLATARDTEQQQSIVAFDRQSGAQAWETIVHEGNFPSSSELHNKGTNANGTLASNGQLVFGGFFNDGKVWATALQLDGTTAWQTDLGEFVSIFGFAPSPVLYKSLVIYAVDHSGGGHITAVDSETGKVAWRIRRPAVNSHSSPYIARIAGEDQLLICGCNLVASYDPATGQENWSTTATSETTCGTMVAQDDLVFAAGGYPDRQTICLDASGNKVWENRTKVYEPSLLAVPSGLFAVSDDGIAYCWDPKSGDERWKKRLGGNFSSSPVYCGGNIYASDLGGRTYVFQADANGFRQVSENRLGNDSYASPAIVQGQIFMRVGFGQGRDRKEKLVCIADT